MRSILVLEDDFQLSVEISRAFRFAGFDVDCVRTATEAKVALSSKRYQAIVTDIIVKVDGSPVADGGLSLISWVKHSVHDRAPSARLPVVAISGAIELFGMQHILETAKSLGADKTLRKPFSLSELVAVVQELVAAKEA